MELHDEPTHYDAAGFDDDLEDVAQVAKAEDAGRFDNHPRGKYHGRIDGITAKTVTIRGKQTPIWEVKVVTEAGEATYSIFGWAPGEVGAAKAKAQSGHKEDFDRIQASIARYKRLFVDLGLDSPAGWAKGDNTILGRLPELIGRDCTLVVQADNRDHTKSRVFINAPVRDGSGELADPTAGPGLDVPDFGAPAPGLNDIPF